MELKPSKHSIAMQDCTVSKVHEENYRIKTLELGKSVKAEPGQFIMVWVPGAGERPMSIGSASPLSITIANVGAVSSALHSLKAGGRMSFRGPLGKGFSIGKNVKRALLVGGGYGVVPLSFLAREAKKRGVECVAVIGARKKDDIVCADRFREAGAKVEITTDDGSLGTKGNALDGVRKLLGAGEKFDAVYSCGPEMMMHGLALLCQEKKIYCEVSVERIMKCGIGICGSCAAGGKLCCRDGPVFSAREALSFPEFGKKHRDSTGALRDW